MDIRTGMLDDPRVLALLHEHLRTLAPTAPAESRHALDLGGLQHPDITFWCMWDGKTLAGFGALRQLEPDHGEIKSMRTAATHLRRGVGSRMLRHLLDQAGARGYRRVSLETGSMAFFEPARQLYASFGFTPCPPFGDYRPDPNSVFMTKRIEGRIG
ncbi:GNAT family N-acetyltransferase [Dyella sp. A6]|uniref:GNAT family N-acetyltransferase n=1 Tax=Dyella aluminiiresistens TaxID=3069105 RepID=UPI002E767E47|nr:GNAT family N-acetyltransferase [Dyella sp. A6]